MIAQQYQVNLNKARKAKISYPHNTGKHNPCFRPCSFPERYQFAPSAVIVQMRPEYVPFTDTDYTYLKVQLLNIFVIAILVWSMVQ